MRSEFYLIIILITLMYTLYYTYNNDYGLFLFTLLITLSILYLYNIIDETFNFNNLISVMIDKIKN